MPYPTLPAKNIFVLALLCLFPAFSFAQNPLTFSFNIKTTSTTSAGVYKKDGTLIRTLWSGEKFEQGEYSRRWDGLKDNGEASETSDVVIKVLSGNVRYEWEGAFIGNTSDATSGASKYHSLEPIVGMTYAGGYMYGATNYNEGYPSQIKFDVKQPQQKIWASSKTIMGSQKVATDGTNLYWNVYDPFKKTVSFVYSTRVANDREVTFNAGAKVTLTYGAVFSSAIAYEDNKDAFITSLAVQRAGNLLFVVRPGYGVIQMFNKQTGAYVAAVTRPGAKHITVDSNDNVWVTEKNVIKSYAVSAGGSFTQLPVSVTMPGEIGGLAISPSGDLLAVLDVETQQVKAYNVQTGAPEWTLGKPGGYFTDATVTNDKFYFRDLRHPQGYEIYIAFQPDGSFWVGDGGNFRHQHYSKNRQYLETIMSMPAVYNTVVDQNNPNRILANVLEFEIDYTKPLAPNNGSWILKNNWGANIDPMFNDFSKINSAITMSNGRTYIFLHKEDTYHMYELVPGGTLRRTGVVFGQRSVILPDGSKLVNPEGFGANAESRILKYPLVGYVLNNPVWSPIPQLVATTPPQGKYDPWPTQTFREVVSDGGNVIIFDRDTKTGLEGKEFHLGAIATGTKKWLWKTARGTTNDYYGDFPPDGAFDNGNNVNFYSGGTAIVQNDNIFWGYHGEFWKASQVNKWNHVDARTGLFVGQFGVTGKDFEQGHEAPPQMAGNVFSGGMVKANGASYLYHNDESAHGAVHRWKVTGLETIELQDAVIPSAIGYEPPEGIDLMEGLVDGDLQNAKGWTVGNGQRDKNWLAYVGNKSYDPFRPKDIYVYYYQPSGTASERTITRDLQNKDSLVSWKLSGKVSWEGSRPNLDKNVQYLEVLDNQGKVISRLHMSIYFTTDPNPFKYIGNKKVIKEGKNELILYSLKFQPFEMSFDNGQLKFTYAGFDPVYTNQPIDADADVQSPATFRLYFYSGNTFVEQKTLTVKDLRFVAKAKEPVDTGKRLYRSKNSGPWSALGNWETWLKSTGWQPATALPDTSAGEIKITSGTIINVDTVVVVDELVVESGATLNLMPAVEMRVADGPGQDVVIKTGGKMVVKSTAAGTGIIGPSEGTIQGNVTVERYLAARENPGYRMLTPSVTTTASIRDNWQEGVNNPNPNTNLNPNPGYGMHITGSSQGARGFDAEYNSMASLYYFNDAGANQAWTPIENTDVEKLQAGRGYFAHVKGDRSVDANNMNTRSTNTTLRATGKVLSGDQLFKNVPGGGKKGVIANPYVSPMNWKSIYNDNKQQFENYYIVWDPTLGEVGAFVTIDEFGVTSVKNTRANLHIQCGQAFYVKSRKEVAKPELIIKEQHKSSLQNGNLPRGQNLNDARLYISLHYNDASNRKRLADGVLARFDDSFTHAVTDDDAEDVPNLREDVTLVRNGVALSIESLPAPVENDTLFLQVAGLKPISYQWSFDASNFNVSPDLRPFLVDSYLGYQVPFDLYGVTDLGFSVTSDPASYDPKRFYIVFNLLRVLPLKFLSFTGRQQGSANMLQWKTGDEQNVAKYVVERASNAAQYRPVGEVAAKGAHLNQYTFTDQVPLAGNNYYRVRGIDRNGNITLSDVVLLKAQQAAKAFSLYPNPVSTNTVMVQLNSLAAGDVVLTITNAVGQVVEKRTLRPAQLSGPVPIGVAALAPGVYWVTARQGAEMFSQQLLRQ